MFNTLSLLFHGKSRVLDENIRIKPNIMPNFNKYETKANTAYGDIARKKAMIVTENILPTPFPKTVTKAGLIADKKEARRTSKESIILLAYGLFYY